METVLAVLIGVLVATSVYLMLARSILRFVFGLVLLSNAANLVIFAAGRLTRSEPALIPPGLSAPAQSVANSLPQALVLTAIVIGFGLLAFGLALIFRGYQVLGTLNTDQMRIAEPIEESKNGAQPSPEADAR